jgi:hypothetical protein
MRCENIVVVAATNRGRHAKGQTRKDPRSDIVGLGGLRFGLGGVCGQGLAICICGQGLATRVSKCWTKRNQPNRKQQEAPLASFEFYHFYGVFKSVNDQLV